MEIERYWDSSYEELIETERKLHKQMQWLNSGKYRLSFPIWNKLEPGGDQLNHAWKKPYYWNIPKSFMNLSIRDSYPGIYEYSLHVRHNEEFLSFLKEGDYKKRAQKLMGESKQQLLLKKIEQRNKIDSLNTDLRNELTNLQTHLIFYIEDHAVVVKKYEPHYMGSKDGRNTHKMIELVEGVLFAYRGVMCGSIYAYEYLLTNYIFEEKVFDDLRNLTDQLVEECKEYVVIQIAVEHKRGAGNPTITEEEITWFDNLILKLEEVERNNDTVIRFFKNEVPSFKGDPNRNYFRGGLSQSAFGKAFSEIYKLKFGKSLGERRFRDLFSHDLEKLRIE